ncbi:predicted protein [Sclerotinia sclerotiorum 1980 UF-70]|uniref:Uncharacterized protein n=1 Tax=Sclerotinia sclerotiorum (strain ATCC 18683 / 1980 / Ss-1) TaxID=665079 RepID=A7EJM7_SCLS1|nr:predicted protein [Sclerotinia sclerotiorum 1980 UF-70]EDO03043.1 predicted protein [Sclerotinia sclerotiorum 1980 UF-70]
MAGKIFQAGRLLPAMIKKLESHTHLRMKAGRDQIVAILGLLQKGKAEGSDKWAQVNDAQSIVSNFLTKLFQDEVTPTKCISDILEWAAASDKPPYSNITIQVRQQQNFLANPRKPGGPISKLIEKVISNYPRSDDIQVGTKGVRKTTSLRANIE